MSQGFLKIQRSLYDCPLWRSLSPEYRSIFMSIYFSCVWMEQDFNDHGTKTHLNPGQCVLSEEQIVDLAFPPTKDIKEFTKCKSCVHRALQKFEKLGFSNHKKNHRKTLHTIVREDLLTSFESDFESRANQERIKSESQKKKEKKLKKEEEEAAAGGGSGIFFDRGSGNFVGLTDVFIASLENQYPLLDIWQEIGKMKTWLLTHPKGQSYDGNQAFVEKWLSTAIPSQAAAAAAHPPPLDPLPEHEEMKSQNKYQWK